MMTYMLCIVVLLCACLLAVRRIRELSVIVRADNNVIGMYQDIGTEHLLSIYDAYANKCQETILLQVQRDMANVILDDYERIKRELVHMEHVASFLGNQLHVAHQDRNEFIAAMDEPGLLGSYVATKLYSKFFTEVN